MSRQSYLLLPLLGCYMLFSLSTISVWLYLNPASYRYILVGKGSILIVLAGNCRDSFCYYTQTWQMVKISCNAESKTVSMNFSYSVKFRGLSCTLNGSFTHVCFCNIMHWSARKYWFITLCELSNIDTIMVQLKHHIH